MPLQLLRIGSLYLASLPAESTIMSGYRIRRQLARTLGVDIAQVLVVSYANAYTQYITTPEEYSLQAYEGGSTLFGPYTQPAYQQELDRLAQDMAAGKATVNTLQPVDRSGNQWDLQPGVSMDQPGAGRQFGDVLKDAAPRHVVGETVTVRFQTGHPKNHLRRNDTFLEVQRQAGNWWVTVADDGDWSTRYRWVRIFAAESAADHQLDHPPRHAPRRLPHRAPGRRQGLVGRHPTLHWGVAAV